MRVGLDDFRSVKVLPVAFDRWIWFILDLEWLDPPILYICIYIHVPCGPLCMKGPKQAP